MLLTSVEFWKELHDGWAEVLRDPRRTSRYERETELHGCLADLAQPACDAAAPSQASHSDSDRARPAARRLVDAPRMLAPIDLTGMPSSAPDSKFEIIEERCVCPLDPLRPCPAALHPEKLQQFLRGGSKLCKIEADFKATHVAIAMRRRTITAKAPKQPRWSRTAAGLGIFRQKLEDSLKAFCIQCCPNAVYSVHSAKLCLELRVQGEGAVGDVGELDVDDEVAEPTSTLWAVAWSGNAAAGVIPFRMNFALCHRVADPSLLEATRVASLCVYLRACLSTCVLVCLLARLLVY